MTSIGSLTRPLIPSWPTSIPKLVSRQIANIALEDTFNQIIFEKKASGTNRNTLRTLSGAPLILKNPNKPAEFGSTGVKTTKHKETR